MVKVGWSSVKCVIRHKCNKAIYRVHTSDGGIMDVTEDHSLLDSEGKKLRPGDAKIGQKLLVNYDLADTLKDELNYYIGREYKKIWNKSDITNKHDKSIEYLYNLIWNEGKMESVITNIELLYEKYDDYVYDIEVEDGTFNTGFSAIIKNTIQSL